LYEGEAGRDDDLYTEACWPWFDERIAILEKTRGRRIGVWARETKIH